MNDQSPTADLPPITPEEQALRKGFFWGISWFMLQMRTFDIPPEQLDGFLTYAMEEARRIRDFPHSTPLLLPEMDRRMNAFYRKHKANDWLRKQEWQQEGE